MEKKTEIGAAALQLIHDVYLIEKYASQNLTQKTSSKHDILFRRYFIWSLYA